MEVGRDGSGNTGGKTKDREEKSPMNVHSTGERRETKERRKQKREGEKLKRERSNWKGKGISRGRKRKERGKGREGGR